VTITAATHADDKDQPKLHIPTPQQRSVSRCWYAPGEGPAATAEGSQAGHPLSAPGDLAMRSGQGDEAGPVFDDLLPVRRGAELVVTRKVAEDIVARRAAGEIADYIGKTYGLNPLQVLDAAARRATVLPEPST
jgi:hypothetical protein